MFQDDFWIVFDRYLEQLFDFFDACEMIFYPNLFLLGINLHFFLLYAFKPFQSFLFS